MIPLFVVTNKGVDVVSIMSDGNNARKEKNPMVQYHQVIQKGIEEANENYCRRSTIGFTTLTPC